MIVRWSLAELPEALAEAGIERPFLIASPRWKTLELPHVDWWTEVPSHRVEVPDDRARWIEPGEEGNKLGYYRVYGTRIVYEVDGKERTFDVSSLISWRGEWYVVHLTGFK